MLTKHPEQGGADPKPVSYRQNGVPSDPMGLVLENPAQNAPFNIQDPKLCPAF